MGMPPYSPSSLRLVRAAKYPFPAPDQLLTDCFYNHVDVFSSLLKRLLILVMLLTVAPGLLAAQQSSAAAPRPQPATSAPASEHEQVHGKLLLVMPFENHSGQPSLDWIGEGFPEIFNRRLASAGFLPISRGDRLYALDHLGLPLNFQPSRASTIRLAQTLDADYVISGYYTTQGKRIVATAQVLDVTGLKLDKPIAQQADLDRLLDVLNGLAWRVVKQMDPAYPVAEQTFLAADSSLRLSAFENYVRGLVEDSPAERIRHLREALRLSPDFPPARLALGRAYFADQQYENAAAIFGSLPSSDPNALEADFYRGLSFFYTGNYMKAEDAFAFDATRLPLPEVVNDEGVAASRRGKDGVPLFQQAIAYDPKDADYHFNLAIALFHRGDARGALREIQQELKLRPNDTEAQAFETTLSSAPKAGDPNPSQTAAATPGPETGQGPLERIKRSYNEAGFRQAAFELEQMQDMRLATMEPAQRAAALIKDGDQLLNRGLLLEAEREFHAALAADSSSAAACAGLAQVRERTGDATGAREEAQKSLRLQPNVPAHLVLARLDLESKQLAAAASEVSQALRADPANANALGMKKAIESRGQPVS